MNKLSKTLALTAALVTTPAVAENWVGIYQIEQPGELFPSHYLTVHEVDNRLIIVANDAGMTEWEAFDGWKEDAEWVVFDLLHSDSTKSASGWIQKLPSNDLVWFMDRCAPSLTNEVTYQKYGTTEEGKSTYTAAAELVEQGCFIQEQGFARFNKIF